MSGYNITIASLFKSKTNNYHKPAHIYTTDLTYIEVTLNQLLCMVQYI